MVVFVVESVGFWHLADLSPAEQLLDGLEVKVVEVGLEPVEAPLDPPAPPSPLPGGLLFERLATCRPFM